MSFKHECNYLSALVIDYKKKLKDPFWMGFEDFFKQLIIKTERKLYLIKEQELCEQLTSIKTTNTISQSLSIGQNRNLLKNGWNIVQKIASLEVVRLRDLLKKN